MPCEAPYCLALLYYIHVQHKRSLPFTYNPASVLKKSEVLRVSHVHTTSTAQFRLLSADEITEVRVRL